MTSHEMTPDLWLDYYFAGEYFSGELLHLKTLIEELGLHTGHQKLITIAGTNGKGETSRRISRLLLDHHENYACFTSPHLFSVVERFHFNGNMITNDELIECFEQTKIKLLAIERPLSFFEFLFLVFLSLCQKKKIEILVLEVGLGGRLDATNCLDADICAITSISRDHQDLLGKSYRSILNEKMGVLRKNKILISALELNYLQNIVNKKINDLQIKWIDGFKNKTLTAEDNFSKRNKFIAESIFYLLFPQYEGEDIVDRQSEESEFSKRLQLKIDNGIFDFYSSHNVDGVRKLVHFLSQAKYNKYDYLIISFSDRELVDLRVMVKILLSFFGMAKIYLYEFSHIKAVSSSKLHIIKDDFKLEITNKDKIQEQLSFLSEGRTLCTGSQYFFTDLSKALQGHRH